MEFHDKIKALRLEKKLTLAEIGKRVGVGKSTVRKWENGDIKNMGRDKIQSLALALGVTPGYLMGWESESGSNTDNDVAAVPKTPEARAVSFWMDGLPEAQRKFVESLVIAAVKNLPEQERMNSND